MNRTDYHKAADFFTLTADAQHTGAQLQSGSFYKRGNGVPQNLEKTLKYYNTAANNGSATAMVVPGVFYQNGNGVEQDNQKH